MASFETVQIVSTLKWSWIAQILNLIADTGGRLAAMASDDHTRAESPKSESRVPRDAMYSPGGVRHCDSGHHSGTMLP